MPDERFSLLFEHGFQLFLFLPQLFSRMFWQARILKLYLNLLVFVPIVRQLAQIIDLIHVGLAKADVGHLEQLLILQVEALLTRVFSNLVLYDLLEVLHKMTAKNFVVFAILVMMWDIFDSYCEV